MKKPVPEEITFDFYWTKLNQAPEPQYIYIKYE